MCGIFAILNNEKSDQNMISEDFLKRQKRGREFTKLENSYMKMGLGFPR